jgi:hypothetical protein
MGPILDISKDPKAAPVLAETPLRKFLFLKIPVGVTRRRAQEILAHAWRMIAGEAGQADWADWTAAERAALEEAVCAKTMKSGLKALYRGIARRDKLAQASVSAVRISGRQPSGNASLHAKKRNKAKALDIRKRVDALRRDGKKIETAFGLVAEQLDISESSVRRHYYSE